MTTTVAEARGVIGRRLRAISPMQPVTWVLPLAVMSAALLSMRQSFTVRATNGLTPTQAAIVAGIGLLTALVITGRFRMPPPPLVPTIALLTAFSVILTAYAIAATRGLTADQCLTSDRALLFQVIVIGCYVLIVTVIRTRHAVVMVLRGLVVGATISSLFALVQTATGVDLAPNFRIPVLLKADATTLVTDLLRAGSIRPQGSAGHPLELSAVLTTVVPLALAVTLYSRARGERWWLWASATGIIVLAALSTVSRSAIVGMAVIAGVFALFSPIKRTLIGIAGAAGLVAVAWALNVPMLSRLTTVISSGSQDGSLESRGYGARYVSLHLTDNLWFGQGPGTYDLTRQPVLDNEYLTRLIEGGVFGLAAFCVILVVGIGSALYAGYRAVRAKDRVTADLAACIAAALAVIAVTATVLDVSGFAQITSLMMLLIPLAVVLTRGEQNSDPA